MKIKHIALSALVSLTMLASGNGFAGEQVTVDKEEYEQLKAAVKFLMSEREENQKAVQEARQEILRTLAPKFEAVLKDIIQVDQIDLVLNPQTLQYANPKHDITRRVTEKMNEQREE